MIDLCKYKHIFGIENEGIHSYRIFNIAIVDTLLALLLVKIFHDYYVIDYLYSFLLVFVLGIFFHRIFCVNTTINKILFGTV
jgi:hypothetical protein